MDGISNFLNRFSLPLCGMFTFLFVVDIVDENSIYSKGFHLFFAAYWGVVWAKRRRASR